MAISTATWHWPQWAMIALMIIGLLIGIKNHRRIDPTPDSAFHSLISIGIMLTILYAALERTTERLHVAAIQCGSDPDFVEQAVADNRALIAEAKKVL